MFIFVQAKVTTIELLLQVLCNSYIKIIITGPTFFPEDMILLAFLSRPCDHSPEALTTVIYSFDFT